MNGPLFLYWNLGVLIFEQRGKPENPEKNLSEQSREPTTNSAHMIPCPGIELALSLLRHPSS